MTTIQFRSLKPNKTVKLAFIVPPARYDFLMQPLAWMLMSSYYKHYGLYPDNVEWLNPPYRWNKYKDESEVWEEIKDADVFLFSSYVWNYAICDKIAAYVKKQKPDAICIVGGPHIGQYDKKFLDSRTCYDYICKATKPGEIFMADFLNEYISSDKLPGYDDISWELRGNKTCNQFIENYSVYEEHLGFISSLTKYAKDNNISRIIAIETTRGCPYSCTYCEWGGGTGVKVLKKDLDIVKRDIDAIAKAGYEYVEYSDANFGIFKERDLEIYEYMWASNLLPVNLAMVKLKDAEKRKDIFRRLFEIVEKNNYKASNNDVFPALAIQTISEDALKVAKRVDITLEEKIDLSSYINENIKRITGGLVYPETIMAMPGSTLDDFYNEYNIAFKYDYSCNTKYLYIVTPDSETANPEYLEKYNIKLVETLSDLTGVNYRNVNLPSKPHIYETQGTQKTISSCFSYTKDDVCQMWIMNFVAMYVHGLYKESFSNVKPSDFMREVWEIIKTTPDFDSLWVLVSDIFDPETPPISPGVEPLVEMYFSPFMFYIKQRLQQRFKNEIIARV